MSTTGCAAVISGTMNATTTDKDLVEKTANYFATTKGKITISAIEKGTFTTSYRAKYSGKIYNCYMQYGGVSCKQPGT